MPKFLNDQFAYSENSFAQLQYTKSFIQHAKIKTLKIYKCWSFSKLSNNNLDEPDMQDTAGETETSS